MSEYIDTEAGFSDFIWDCCFKDWKDELVDFMPNYSGECLEPEFLITKYPLVLFTGSLGLGYGLYSGVPNYNFTDICKLVKELVKNPNKKNVSAIPDFPNGCLIVDTDFEKINRMGEGVIRMRGEIDIDEKNNLVIKSIPYRATLNKIIDEQIPKLVEKSKLNYFHDIVNESYKDPKDLGNYVLNVKVILKPGADAKAARDLLYKSTDLEKSFAIDMEMVYNYQNVHYNLKSYLLDWIEFRRETKRRYYLLSLSKLSKEKDMLEVVVSFLSDPKNDKMLATMSRSAANKKELVQNLIKKLKLTDVQAEVIAEFKQYHFSKENIKRCKEDLKDVTEKLKYVEDRVEHEEYIDEEIIQEMDEGIKKYGRPRVCKVIKVDDPNVIDDTLYRITMTKHGYVYKNLPEAEINLESGDKIADVIDIENDRFILVFDNKGKCYRLPVNDIPVTTSDSNSGIDLVNYINLTQGKVIKILPLEDKYSSKDYFLFVTKGGMIKKTLCSNYVNANKRGLMAIDLKSDDKSSDIVVDVLYINKNKEIMIYTSHGNATRFNTKEVNETMRMTVGMIGIKLGKSDKVVGIDIVKKDQDYLVVLTNKGNGKRVKMDNCPASPRSKYSSYQLITVSDDEDIIGLLPISNSDKKIDVLFNNRIETIKVKDIKATTKIAKGEKLVKVKRGEQILGICKNEEEK